MANDRTLNYAQIARALLLSPDLDSATAQEHLTSLGFSDPARADRLLQDLAQEPPIRERFAQVAPYLLEFLRNCSHPDMALSNLHRLLNTGLDPLGTYHFWSDYPVALERLIILLSDSQLLADILIRDPGLLDLIYDPEALLEPKTRAQMTAELTQRLQAFRTTQAQRNALRRYKRQEFLRIAARDLLAYADLATATRELSDLAEALLQVALSFARAHLEAQYGPPRPGEKGESSPPQFAIIGMGKLGGRELNYNSDIDVLFVYHGDGQTHPPQADQQPLSNREFFERLARRLLSDIGDLTEEGRAFRVDARLRPEGSSGPLVRSLDGYLSYYEAWGEPWETQALLKARFVAGDPELGRRFEALAETIAYGQQLDLAAITAIRETKRRLEQRAVAEGTEQTDVKQGYGGIRDIEFTVQLLQLVHGLQDPRVRQVSTLEALNALQAAGYLSEEERSTLAQAYIFLRHLEHYLQLQQDVPRFALPDDPAGLTALAKRMGYTDTPHRSAGEQFRRAYEQHSQQVRRLCERLFYHPLPETDPLPIPPHAGGRKGGPPRRRGEEKGARLRLLLDPLVPHEEAAAALENCGFRQPAEARRRLIFLAYGEPPMRLPERIQQVFVHLLPRLLAALSRTPDPDAAIKHFEQFITRAGGRQMFYEFLAQNPPMIDLLCLIGGASEYLSRTLVDHPEYLDLITDPATMERPKYKEELRTELRDRLAPLRTDDLRLADLRHYKRRELFRIGVRDLEGRDSLEDTLAQISDLADVCLEIALNLVTPTPAQRGKKGELPFAVIGLGKLGSRELHYSSDLDLLFVCAPSLPAGKEGVAEDLATRFLKAVTDPLHDGVLYHLDTRLRPFGPSGQLVRTLESYRHYYQIHGEVWERLALTRARFVAGDPELGRQFVTLAHEIAYSSGLSADDLAAIRHLKRRVETERPDLVHPLSSRSRKDKRERVDVKLIPGGIFELEFLVQTLQLKYGAEHPRLRCPNTLAALYALREEKLLPPENADLLIRAYRRLRRLECRLQLVHERSSAAFNLTPDELALVARRLGYAPDDRTAQTFWQECQSLLHSVHAIYTRLIGLEA
ncbi:MAG TPA: bifunctional [glutamate--ammonia ligase]-adenylyl-L-tyrosine phosphorylase/[glutamate--ammonia-ligase] adenylyltransferase [Armatimonadetes bacterium]|nr:bifunctional [glutamate--ammonia ligase]-adenylyl-L-tyrosine phosphorylase/[glutamate--ammonia-ligase] adenylyltransferase [Armatimonadota bacterium]